MQLRKMMLVLSALGAMSGLMAGCGDDDPSGTTCSGNDDCAENEICHPDASVCVLTCTTGNDCPASAKTCAELGGTSSQSDTLICQCSTDALCNGGSDGTSSDLVCSNLDNVCVPACDSNDDCGSGRVCDTASGQCEEDDTGPTTCSGTGQSTCLYGQFCSSGTCTEVPAPTCANFDPAQGGKQPVWTISSSGPIIYDITQVSFGQDTFCGTGSGTTGMTAKARVRAYQSANGSGTFPAQVAGLPGFFYVRVNGSQIDGVQTIRPSEYTTSNNGKNAEFTMNFCPGASATTLSIGIYFTNGNEICSQLTR
ncbi:hypothetical protein SAMN05443572_106445 [Myxococcus fulvus]|jgi:hypothetical protein|uniref:Lipoprotein n=1 Tax=Myxococcus fulvus TaxID=33 RepID=A0A511T1V5_MYXFU|nr:hypothetical protein [Myxococcus fulvus]AKF82615.1 hypothetical protein MFUL124B02_29145 [Myxococcus fulvus 124B02]GEN08131.1 hypothetical protein MFU01_31680 [Myxococcus fulvus]SEU22767.1 hypothetical protein SAMN05443572_106445 [Myxococcus fulvus]